MSRISGVYEKLKHAIICRITAQYSFLLAYIQRRRFDWFIRPKAMSIESLDGSALVFAPHQDDETLGCGGLIALKRQQRIPVNVAFLTDGSACYDSIALAGVTVMPAIDVIKLRKQEATEALGRLGVNANSIHFLDQPDQFLDHQALEHDALINRLVDLLNEIAPQDIYVTYRYDVHGDHQATYRLVHEAIVRSGRQVRLWEYPIWSFWSHEQLSGLVRSHRHNLYRLPIQSVLAQKKTALKCYKSQFQTLPGTISPVLSANFMTYLSSSATEVFVMTQF